MLDVEKLAKEFVFLREKLQGIASAIVNENYSDAAFMAGCLYNICHNHAVTIGALVPPKFEPMEPAVGVVPEAAQEPQHHPV